MVQVRIDRTPDGAAHVTVTAERPETLQAITQAEAQLHRGLDNAGVPGAGRTITFNLTPESQAAASLNPGAHAPSQSATHSNDTAANPDGGNAGGGQAGGSSSGEGDAGSGAGGQGGNAGSQERWQSPWARTRFSLQEAETADQPEPV
jgi:hypothetical protein